MWTDGRSGTSEAMKDLMERLPSVSRVMSQQGGHGVIGIVTRKRSRSDGKLMNFTGAREINQARQKRAKARLGVCQYSLSQLCRVVVV